MGLRVSILAIPESRTPWQRAWRWRGGMKQGTIGTQVKERRGHPVAMYLRLVRRASVWCRLGAVGNRRLVDVWLPEPVKEPEKFTGRYSRLTKPYDWDRGDRPK